jgi:hypothetical protein
MENYPITPTDIRIGNLVMDLKGKFFEVEEIHTDGLMIKGVVVPFNAVQAIPLTVRILEHVQFEFDDELEGWGDDFFDFHQCVVIKRFDNGSFYYLEGDFVKVNILTLHNLQNLYKTLRGKEIPVDHLL